LQLTVSQSVSALSPSGTHDQTLVVVKTIAFLFVLGHSLPLFGYAFSFPEADLHENTLMSNLERKPMQISWRKESDHIYM
jgi:hypothetical protein